MAGMGLQEKVDKYVSENGGFCCEDDLRSFFEWLQGCEYSGSEVEDNGRSGQYPDKNWYTIRYENGDEEDFYL